MATEWAQNSWLLKLYPAVRGRPGMLQGCVIKEPINKQMQRRLQLKNGRRALKPADAASLFLY